MVQEEFHNGRLDLQLHEGSSSAGAGRLALLRSEEKADDVMLKYKENYSEQQLWSKRNS